MMKIRIFLSGLFLLGLGFPAFAQRGFHVGADYGFNAISLIDKNKLGNVDYDYKLKFGSSLGIEAGNNFTDNFGIQAEVNYAWLGQDYKITEEYGTVNKELNLRYFEVPVLLKFTGGDYKSRFTAMIGPDFGFLQGARMKADQDSSSGAYNMSVTNKFKRPDLGILLAAGGDISVYENFYVSVELRLYYGFNKINQDEPRLILNRPDENEKLSNAWGGLNVGLHYLFRGSKNTPAK
jgi:hypothetical protein